MASPLNQVTEFLFRIISEDWRLIETRLVLLVFLIKPTGKIVVLFCALPLSSVPRTQGVAQYLLVPSFTILMLSRVFWQKAKVWSCRPLLRNISPISMPLEGVWGKAVGIQAM
jgi:hypothetical protein